MEAAFNNLHLNLAFTGVASSPFERTIDRLSAILKQLPPASTLQNICDALAKHCASAMKPHGSHGVLTLVLAVATVGKPFRIAVVSNVKDWNEFYISAKKHFDVQIRTVKKPLHLISGFRGCVSPPVRQRLKSLARDEHRTAAEICDTLATINATAARNSGGLVSEGCWVSSQIADGERRRSTIRNVGEHGDAVPHLRGGVDLIQRIKQNFQAAPGQELRVTHLGGVMGPGTPLPPPEGDPRRFMLSGSAITAPLRTPSGQHCANIQIAQLDCVINARLNETVIVPFARVRVDAAQTSSSADFQQPKPPYPHLSAAFAVDGISVDRGWEYSIVYWIENGVQQLVVPRMSRGLRRLAFLKDDDELVIASVSETRFSWRTAGENTTATLEASVSWRRRLDGTRG